MREEAGASHLSKLKYWEWEKSMKTQESWPLLQTGLNEIRESKDCNTALALNPQHGPLCAPALSIRCLALRL